MQRINGFTLIELMVVVVVIGILAAMGVPRFLDYTRNAKEAEAKPLLRQVRTLEERHRAKTGAYTTDLSALEGGAGLATSGRYFSYDVVAHSSGFCVVATPDSEGAAASLDPQSLDATGRFYENAACS